MAARKSYFTNPLNLLQEQFHLLLASAQAFDAGESEQAHYMPLQIRFLLHEGRSPSLLRQVNKMDILFLDSACAITPSKVLTQSALAYTQLPAGQDPLYTPRCAYPDPEQPSWVPFEIWWSRTVIIHPTQSGLTRRDLVVRLSEGDEPTDPQFRQAEWASIRQIAFEVLESLKHEFPAIDAK